MKRLLIYSQDGMGLGHLRRSSNIAEEVLARSPRTNILIVADSPSATLFGGHARTDVVKLPTIVKTGSASWRKDNWENGTLRFSLQRIVDLRARLMLETFEAFQPDAILIDHMPVGALGELKPLLDRASRQRHPPRMFLGLRDILDAPAVIRQVWSELDAYEYLGLYDAVLIYGSADIYDADSAYMLSPYASSIVYCNYVVSGNTSVASRRFTEPFVLMMGGGGLDAFPLASAFMRSLPQLHRNSGMGTVVLTGPNMRTADRDALDALARPGFEIHTALEHAEGWIQAASAVVTLGGYNSLCEVLKWRRKALVVPRAGPSAEQQTRTELFAERKLVKMLKPDLLAPQRVADSLATLLADDGIPTAENIPPLNGAKRSASILLDGPPKPSPPLAKGNGKPTVPTRQTQGSRATDTADVLGVPAT